MESSVARFQSLLKWVNTFDGINCESFRDLASGKVLLKCLQMIMPDVTIKSTSNPWREMFTILEECCGCSLDKAVSTQQITAGNQEHISRVVVLLLSVAVQSKNNESVVAAITSLDYVAQRDIMFFIESTLAKVKSHAIVAGTFTSGVGDALPNLECSGQVSSPSSPPSQPSTPISDKGSGTPPLLAHKASDEVFPFPTPHRPSKNLRARNFYNGLDSSAGAKLLMSPAITGFKRSNYAQSSFTPMKVPEKSEKSEEEEILRLKHSIRVLEGTLQVEKKLAQEYYAELCIKIKECEDYKRDYCQLERKLDCLRQMNDIQDELAHANINLATAEKSLANYKNKIESLVEYKERAIKLEGELMEFESTASECELHKRNVQKLESSLMEKMTAMKHLELQLNKVTIELETKSTHLESLLQENREYKQELSEAKSKLNQLEGTVSQLQSNLDTKADTELVLIQEKRQMTVEIEKIQASLQTYKSNISELNTRKKENEAYITALERERRELSDELSAKISELVSMDFQVKSQESAKKELELQIVQLESTARDLEQTLTVNEVELNTKKSELASKDVQLKSLENTRKELEGQVTWLQSSAETLKQSAGDKETELQKEISAKTSELTSRDNQIASLEAAKKNLQDQITKFQSTIEILEQVVANKEAEVISKDLEVKALGAEKKEIEVQFKSTIETLEQVVANKEAEVISKDLEVKALEDEKKEIEVQFKSTIERLEQVVANKEAEVIAKDLEVKALGAEKKEIEVQSIERLEQVVANKEAEVISKDLEAKALEGKKKELEAQVTELQSITRTLQTKEAELHNELKAKISELTSRDNQIMSLESVKRELEGHLIQLQSSTETLNQEINDKDAKLVATNIDLSSLIAQKENLVEEMQNLQKEYNNASIIISECRTEIESKESTLMNLTENNSQLRSKMSCIMQQLSDKQSSLEAANSLVSSLAAQKSDTENRYMELETKLKEVNKLNETSISMYQNKLESSEQLIENMKQYISNLQSEQSEQVKKLVRDNHLLLSKQNKLYDELATKTERNEKMSALVQQLEAELIKIKAEWKEDCTIPNEVNSDRSQSTYMLEGSLAPFRESPDCFASSPSYSGGELPKQLCETTESMVSDFSVKEPDPLDKKARVKELKRRNNQALPHLKSSYPIEMQVRPVTPTTSNERLKNGSKRKNPIKIVQSPLSLEKVCPDNSTSNSPIEFQKPSGFHNTRGEIRETQSQIILPYNLRRLSASQSPTEPIYRRKPLAVERQSLCPSLNLREFLDIPDTQNVPEKKISQVPSSTAFEVTFSPPKVKGAPPKRLQENKQRKIIKESAASESGNHRRETVTRSKMSGNKTQTQSGAGQRHALKSKNK